MAMYNQCPHFDGGILPMYRKKYVCYIARTSAILVISLLVILPKSSIAAAPKYETAYACEGKTLTIECEPGDLISLIRANYGRFSITICNDHGNVEWSVNCMSPKSLRVLHSKCAHRQNCSVLASTNMFGDPCPGTHKYLEAHYQCVSAAQTSTTTNRPSPPWLITSQPSVWSTSTARSATTARIGSIHHEMIIPQTIPKPAVLGSGITSTEIHLAGRPPAVDHNSHKITAWTKSGIDGGTGASGGGQSSGMGQASTGGVAGGGAGGGVGGGSINGHDFGKVYRPTTPSSGRGVLQSTRINSSLEMDIKGTIIGSSTSSSASNNGTTLLGTGDKATLTIVQATTATTLSPPPHNGYTNSPSILSKPSDRQLGGDDNLINNKQGNHMQTTQSSVLVNSNNNNNNNNNNNYDGGDSNYYCGPVTSRNLFWNVTRVGEVNVQPCPGGATGIAKWRCVLVQRTVNNLDRSNIDGHNGNDGGGDCDKYCDTARRGNSRNLLHPSWYPMTPDLTQCRSLWLNNLEIRVNQKDSSLISIANDLSQVTSSKTLYGGDMLVTTKIIQTMSEKMSYDIETFPDQRQREAIIYELLHGVVKTGSNLLDVSQQLSWLDLSFEDQMRVATSLLTGLEDNAFLLADTIIRERNVVQKVKNILLSVRVLETRNIISNEVFPDAKLEQWQVSDDQIELPRGALIENSDGGLVRIVFVAFDRLESILKPSYDNLDVKFSTNYIQNTILNQTNSAQRVRILNSKVISASLGKGRHIQLSQPIRLVLRHLKTENVTNPSCVFWNYIDHAWSEDGCYLETTNRTHTICMCNHLTNFAILMDIVDEHNSSLLSMFDNNMRILIYISIAICILFIIIAILTLKLFNGVFIKSTRTSIYKNIYVCLFIIEILFLLGIEQSEMSLLCGFTTAFLHCFILSAIAWLFFEGFQLYVTLTTDDMLLEVENSSKIIWYYLLSYGLSFTIVAISLAIDPSTYTQSDFCVLMESNALFYTTFVAPVILFVLGAIGYTFLACYIMCRKNKTALKNKEHTRLTNVRFDLRCSFIFLMILSADWVFAYFYLRKAKMEEDISFTYGYLFISSNSLLGIYIFIFHCIQNEKIRREYRKYVRQNSWLPKCLRCSKTSSISSSASHNQQQHYGTASSKKSPITLPPVDSTGDNIIIAGSPKSIIPAYSDSGTGSNCPSILPQHITNPTMGTIPRGHRHNIILERAAGGTLRTPSGGHTSPTSSAGSTHLIFNSTQNDLPQDWNYQQPDQYFQSNPTPNIANDITNKNLNTYDDKFLYYDCKSKRLKQHPSNLRNATQPQHHEYFYWTEKNNRKKINGDLKTHKSDSVHTFYPSYKKTMIKHFTTSPGGGIPNTDDDKLSDSDFQDIENERKYFRYPPTLRQQQHHQQQFSSDEDRADSHLMHSGGTSSSHPSDCFQPDIQSTSYRQQQHHRHKQHSSCDLTNEFSCSIPQSGLVGVGGIGGSGGSSGGGGGVGGGSYYNQSSGPDEPVYEEILNSRMSELCDDDDDDDDNDDDDENDIIMEEDRYNRLRRMISNKEESLRQPFNRAHQKGNFDFNSSKSYRNSPTTQQLEENTPSHRIPQQQVVGRNISAMLDENNTVVCYLEPLPK